MHTYYKTSQNPHNTESYFRTANFYEHKQFYNRIHEKFAEFNATHKQFCLCKVF